MSKELNEARRMFHDRLKEAADNTIYGTVEKIDEGARTCDVRVGGIVYESVALYAIEKADLKGFVFIPKQGSGVMISRVGNSNRRFVELFSEVDKVLLTVGADLEATIDASGIDVKLDKVEIRVDASGMVVKTEKTTLQAKISGFKMTRGSAGLKKTLSDLCAAIGALTVSTSVGPSSIPINKSQFDMIKQDLNEYLEG